MKNKNKNRLKSLLKTLRKQEIFRNKGLKLNGGQLTCCLLFWILLGLPLGLASASSLSAESIGQFYWHFPSTRLNTNPVFTPSTQGTGFHVTPGRSHSPMHLADIGILWFNMRPANPVNGITYNLATELSLGYVYHWSDNYDPSQGSHNIHVGIGFIGYSWGYQLPIAQDGLQTLASINGRGTYWRIAFFRSEPSGNKGYLIGFSVTIKSFNSADFTVTTLQETATTTTVTRSLPVSISDPYSLNSTDLSLIIGTRF